MKSSSAWFAGIGVVLVGGLVLGAWYTGMLRAPEVSGPLLTPSEYATSTEQGDISSTTEPGARTVMLYYYNPKLDTDSTGNILCSRSGLVGVARTIRSRTPIEDTLRLLLRGELIDSERAQGITTEYPLPGFALTSVALSSDGLLRVALTDPQRSATGGSCRTAILAQQIVATAEQFTEVREVEFVPDTIFQP